MTKGVVGSIIFLAFLVVLLVELISERSCSSPAVMGFTVIAWILWLGVYEMIPTHTKYLGNLREFFGAWLAMVGLIGSFAECL